MLRIGLLSIAYLAIYITNRKNYLYQIFGLSCAYLIFLTAFKEMDIPMSLLVMLCFLTLMPKKRYVSKVQFIYFVYIIIYVVIGILFQEKMTTVIIAITRYSFLLLALLQSEKELPQKISWDDFLIKTLKIGTIVEIILAAYLLLNGDLQDRLTINHQAISGSLSVGLIVLNLTLYFAYKRTWYIKHGMIYLLLNFGVILLSGTRGYIVMAVLPLIPFLYDYIIISNEGGRGRRILIFLLLCILMLAGVLFYSQIMSRIATVLRVQDSLGYRENENKFIRDLFVVEPIVNKLFGFGLGGRANHLPYTHSIAVQASGTRYWMVSKLLTETTCHNYIYMILFKQGLLGLGLFIIVICAIKNRIKAAVYDNRFFYYTLLLSLIGIIVSLMFRISGTCGIFETLCTVWGSKIMLYRNNYETSMEEED